MWCYLLSEFLGGNQLLLEKKISMLSNPYKNYTLLYILNVVVFLKKLRCGYILPLIPSFFIFFSKPLIFALTNTLFIIHPPMLYVYCLYCIYNIFFKKEKKRGTSALFFSIFLGGFWSMQELNWGGWWNWDVLECGIGYFWASLIYLLHLTLNKTKSSSTSACVILSSILVSYTMLNKFGIGTSIHAFISSKNLQFNYLIVQLCLVVLLISVYSSLYTIPLMFTFAIFSIYIYFKSCIFFKPILIFITVYLILKKKFFKVKLNKIYHNIVLGTAVCVCLYNFYSIGFYFNFSKQPVTSLFFAKKDLFSLIVSLKSDNLLYIWRDIWLIKPKYRLGAYLDLNATRTLGIRVTGLSFLK